MRYFNRIHLGFLLVIMIPALSVIFSFAQETKESSYSPVIEEPFEQVMAQDKAHKTAVMKSHMDLLNERYDLSKKVTNEITMSGGKPLPVGPTARLKHGLSWSKLAGMTPDEIKKKSCFPYLPLPHPNHDTGGMLFPQMEIKQLSRLQRFDLDFDIPEHFLPEFPPPIYLNTHKDMGDVSRGKLVTIEFFNLVQQLKLSMQEKKDLVAFIRQL